MQTEPAFSPIRQREVRDREGSSEEERKGEGGEEDGSCARKMALTVNPIGFCEN